MSFTPVLKHLAPSFQIVLADIGSAGGVHKRWRKLRSHVSAVLFDPLDQSVGGPRDRYFPVAVAAGPGEATIHVTRRVSMTSALQPNSALLERFWDKPTHTEIVSSFAVPTDSLDNVVSDHGITLDAVKIDIQGGEHAVLSGASRTLGEQAFLAEIEVSFLDRYSGLRPFDEVIAKMREHDFDLIDIGRIKRYRHHNSFGIVNPGLGLGDRAGRLAFCDALFLKKDEPLFDRISSGGGANGADLTLKVVLTLLAHGKADLAAWIFDRQGGRIEQPARDAFCRCFKRLSGRRLGLSGLHLVLDYCASKC